MDGQQRLTSLFQALVRQEPVATHDARKRRIKGWFYVGMVGALSDDVDREESFVFLPVDKMRRDFRNEVEADYSTLEAKFAACLFPMNRIFEHEDWHLAYQEHWDFDRERLRLWQAFFKRVIKPVQQYQLPVIDLGRDTPRDAVCQVFEKVNTGGVTLTVFELLTATFAAHGFDLRADWEERRLQWASQKFRLLHSVSATDFLQAVTLLATRARRQTPSGTHQPDGALPRVGARRRDMLNLSLAEYETWAQKAVEGFKQAAIFLNNQHIFDTKFLPYGSQLIPLAAILTALGRDAEPQGAKSRLSRWYWCGVFGELYSGTTETRLSLDMNEVPEWVKGGTTEPRTVVEAQFAPGRLFTLTTRNSAAYKGVYAMLLREGAVDWRTGESVSATTYFDEAIDIHHIFPRAWCDANGIKSSSYNTIVNKSPLSARTNRIIGGNAPSAYLPKLVMSAKSDTSSVERNISSHLIGPDLLRTDDFADFVADRQRRLLAMIGVYMGKELDPRAFEPEIEEDPEPDEDEDV